MVQQVMIFLSILERFRMELNHRTTMHASSPVFF